MPANFLVAGMARSCTCKIMVVFNTLWNYWIPDAPNCLVIAPRSAAYSPVSTNPLS